jgi:hypothetical protein
MELKGKIIEFFWKFLKDNCEICHGKRDGTRGNENVVNGKIICDYCCCSLDKIDARK